MVPVLSLWTGTPVGAQAMVGVKVVKGGALLLNSEAGVIWKTWSFPMQACLPSYHELQFLLPGSWGPVHLHSAPPCGT